MLFHQVVVCYIVIIIDLICSNNNSSLLEFAFTVSSYQSSHFLSFIYDSLFSVVNHSVVSSVAFFICFYC